MSKPIHHEVHLNASPQRVYDALLTSAQFSKWSGGAPADIANEPGGAFSCFDGMITGRNIELTSGRRIVQAWRAGNWADGVYSIARFDLTSDGSGTQLTFDHVGFPEDMRPHLDAGWSKMYWEPLKAHLS